MLSTCLVAEEKSFPRVLFFQMCTMAKWINLIIIVCTSAGMVYA